MPKWQIGDKILNRYEIYSIRGGPGKSGWGIVYICYDHKYRIPLAVKTFQDQYLLDQRVRDDFTKEALTWVSLERHRNIVKAEWVLNIEGRPYIFLEYVPGTDLRTWLGTERLDLLTALDFAAQFCNGMEYAFNKINLVHRDIKPSNILVSEDRTVKITDFGLAKAIVRTEAVPTGMSAMGHAFAQSGPAGYVIYMSPEQWTGANIDTRADIYSFGIVLYQMIAGKHPYPETKLSWQERHMYASPLPIQDPIIPEGLKCLVFRCLEKSPNGRYQNFAVLKSEICAIYEALSNKRMTLDIAAPRLMAWELCNKAIALSNIGRHKESLECCDKALEVDPTFVDALVMKGSALGKLQRHKECLECCDKALEMNPECVQALTNRGVCFADLGLWTEAIQSYDRALGVDPRHVQTLINKGEALGVLKRFQEALECCDKALSLDPGSTDALVLKAMILNKLSKYKESLELYDKALKVDPRFANALALKAGVLGKLGKCQESVECCDEALKIDRRCTAAWVNKGMSLFTLQKYDDALQCANTALAIDLNCEPARNLRKICLQQFT